MSNVQARPRFTRPTLSPVAPGGLSLEQSETMERTERPAIVSGLLFAETFETVNVRTQRGLLLGFFGNVGENV